MYLLVNRIIFTIYITAFTLIETILIIFYYHKLTIKPLSFHAVTYIAQSFLFTNGIMTLFFLIMGLMIPFYSKIIDKELDKLGKASERGNYNSNRAIYNLGRLGAKINRIIRNVRQVSEVRKDYIIAQDQLLHFCSNSSETIFLITDVDGAVQYYSKAAMNFFNLKPTKDLASDAEEKHFMVEDILPTVDFFITINQLSKRFPIVTKENYDFYAAFSSTNIPHFIFIKPHQENPSEILKDA